MLRGLRAWCAECKCLCGVCMRCVRVCVARVRACEHQCVDVCVGACVRESVRVCFCVCVCVVRVHMVTYVRVLCAHKHANHAHVRSRTQACNTSVCL